MRLESLQSHYDALNCVLTLMNEVYKLTVVCLVTNLTLVSMLIKLTLVN